MPRIGWNGDDTFTSYEQPSESTVFKGEPHGWAVLPDNSFKGTYRVEGTIGFYNGGPFKGSLKGS